jgi:hypothetical protein
MKLSEYADRDEKTIAVDFDRTLCSYASYPEQGLKFGEPIQPMVDLVKGKINAGEKVVIFTARAKYPEQIKLVGEWCKEHLGQKLEVTNIKRMTFTKIYDDLAVAVEPNTGKLI